MAARAERIKEVDLLIDNNYYPWSRRIQAALKQKRWWEAISPGYPNQDDPEEEEWTQQQMQRNEDALNYIIQRVDDLNLYNIDHCLTAKSAWEKLKEIRTKLDVIQLVDVIEELVCTNKTDSMSMRDYIGKVTRLMKEVESVISKMADNMDAMTAAFMIRGLKVNHKYDHLVQSFRDSKQVNANDVRAKLIFEETRTSFCKEEGGRECKCNRL